MKIRGMILIVCFLIVLTFGTLFYIVTYEFNSNGKVIGSSIVLLDAKDSLLSLGVDDSKDSSENTFVEIISSSSGSDSKSKGSGGGGGGGGSSSSSSSSSGSSKSENFGASNNIEEELLSMQKIVSVDPNDFDKSVVNDSEIASVEKIEGNEETEQIAIESKNCKENSRETDEGPGGDYCNFDNYEECYDYKTKSTVIAWGWSVFDGAFEVGRKTDWCSSDNILQEAYLNCGLFSYSDDEIKFKQKDCNDYDRYGDYEYFCEDDKVRRKRFYHDYSCSDGACAHGGSWRYETISEKGDGDYCSKRKQYTDDDAPDCTLCGHGDYDCDSSLECSGDLKCKGPIGGAADGCCKSDEEWDTNKMKCVEIECSKNSDCGKDGYSPVFCKNDDEYQTYKTYTCNNPGIISASCSVSTTDKKNKECGTSGYTGNNFCYDNDLYRNYLNKGCSSNSCFSNTEQKKQQECGTSGYSGDNFCYNNDVYVNFLTKKCSSAQCTSSTERNKLQECGVLGCEGGKCKLNPIKCSKNSDCGTNGYTGSKFCKSDDEYQTYKTYTCNSPGTSSSSCSSSTTDNKILECGTLGCEGGKCKDAPIICSKNSDCGENGYGPILCDNDEEYKIYTTYICNNPGTATSSCSIAAVHEKVKDCGTLGCSNGACNQNIPKPDLIVTDLVVQNIKDNMVVLGFTVKNIGKSVANNVYWTIDTDSSDENPSRTIPITLDAGNFTRAYMSWTYSEKKNYNPTIIVDPSNLVDESNEDNNRKSVSATLIMYPA